MNYRKFGNTSLQVSETGFGAWAIGGNAMVGNVPIGWGVTDDKLATAAIQECLAQGLNFFDTADFYGLGHSEELLGKVLKGKNEVIIATKVGHRNINENIVLDYSGNYIMKACELSLQRLQRDVIDYYQLHSARLNHLQNGECIDAMETLKRQGKIRYWGLSLNTFEPAPEAEFMMSNNVGDGFQLVFNLINQQALDIMKKASGAGYGIIARMPLQFGLLTGKFTRERKFATDDHRNFRLTPEIIDEALTILEEDIWPLCNKYQCTKTALALGFVLSFPEVSTLIPGIRTVEQARENTAASITLSQEDKDLLTAVFATRWQPLLRRMQALG